MRVWLECMGSPPHAQSKENIRKIGEIWGNVICFDNKTSKGLAFNSAKILVDSCIFQYIQQWIVCLVDGKAFDVYVKEVSFDYVNLWKIFPKAK